MSRQQIDIRTEDGIAKAAFVSPAKPVASKAGVILYMDAYGLRPALYAMAERLAGQGYAMLVPDLFYRFGDYGPLDAKTAFSDPDVKPKLMQMLSETSQDMTRRDSGAFVRTLRERGIAGPIGTIGYCMGGGRALNAAAAYPDDIAAAASFHGGRLASDAPDSPHRSAASIKARVYVGSAGVDNSFPPEQSGILAETFRAAGVDYILENYVGMEHGWCIPDHNVYNEEGAERHWARLITFFAETLA